MSRTDRLDRKACTYLRILLPYEVASDLLLRRIQTERQLIPENEHDN